MTVLEVIHRSAEYLARKGIEPARLQAELLLGHLLKLPRMQLYLNFERQLTAQQIEDFRGLIQRRSQHEPLQQIVGSTSFCGLELAVNRHVLVPRPETELLAEQGWQFLNRLDRANSQNETQLSALDFGTGSGCLAIALAVKSPAAQVYALDISSEALTLARENAARHGLGGQIQFLQGESFAALPPQTLFNLIISNPPYIPTAEIETLAPEVRDFEPRRALEGGPDGLDYYRKLADEALPLLKSGGKIMLEFGDGQAERVAEIFRLQKWIVEAILADYTGRPRILIAHG